MAVDIIQFKNQRGENVYPCPYQVGDLYFTTRPENPASLWGGTWSLFGPGRTVVCVDTTQTEFNTIQKTGGHKSLQNHNHGFTPHAHGHGAGVNNGGEHTHTMWFGGGANSGNGGQIPVANSRWGQDTGGMSHSGFHDHGGVWIAAAAQGGDISYTGNGNAQNLQPFITCYIWLRTG